MQPSEHTPQMRLKYKLPHPLIYQQPTIVNMSFGFFIASSEKHYGTYLNTHEN